MSERHSVSHNSRRASLTVAADSIGPAHWGFPAVSPSHPAQ